MKNFLELDQIIFEKLPQHIAIIMDGNGRWARKKTKNRLFGHQNAIKSVRDSVEFCAELGIKNLSLYTFSKENWNRPKVEILALMDLLVKTIKNELNTLIENKIKLICIGDTLNLPENCKKQLFDAIEKTKHNSHMNLILAIDYSSKWEIENAMKQIAIKIKENNLLPEDINQNTISQHLQTKDIPNPELLIRTSGEHRISNFLLWQIAYSELYFTDTLWPDFRKKDLLKAILEYQKRERRFGKTSEQLQENK